MQALLSRSAAGLKIQGKRLLPSTSDRDPQSVHLNDSALEEERGIPRRPGVPRVFQVSYRTLNDFFHKARRQAGIQVLRPHDTKHTFYSRLVELGANLRVVQELARHKQIEMAVRYAHLTNDYLGETVRILGTQPVGQKSGQKSLAASSKEPENT